MQRETLRAVRTACERSADVLNSEVKRGIESLKVIAYIASFLGVLESIREALNVVPPPVYGDVAGGPSECFIMAAAGFAVASVAMFCHGILSAGMEQLRLDMKVASLQLLNELSRPSTHIWRTVLKPVSGTQI